MDLVGEMAGPGEEVEVVRTTTPPALPTVPSHPPHRV